MPRPSKPVKVLKMEDKSHRTKKELAMRSRGEKAVLSGGQMMETYEVASDPVAHEEFLLLSELLSKIDKNDALYTEVINRYCLLKSECIRIAESKKKLENDITDLREADLEPKDYYILLSDLSKQLISYDRQLQQKRKMMFDIEKENIMTIASALRSVPKQPEKKTNLLMEALSGG